MLKKKKTEDVKKFLDDNDDELKPGSEYIMLHLAKIYEWEQAYEDIYTHFELKDLSIDEGEIPVPASLTEARKDEKWRHSLMEETIDACIDLKEKLCLH